MCSSLSLSWRVVNQFGFVRSASAWAVSKSERDLRRGAENSFSSLPNCWNSTLTYVLRDHHQVVYPMDPIYLGSATTRRRLARLSMSSRAERSGRRHNNKITPVRENSFLMVFLLLVWQKRTAHLFVGTRLPATSIVQMMKRAHFHSHKRTRRERETVFFSSQVTKEFPTGSTQKSSGFTHNFIFSRCTALVSAAVVWDTQQQMNVLLCRRKKRRENPFHVK